jgi:diguanylate cyclase (GGDEF)-like protein/PAS domain S-box-containing protein
MNRSPTVFLVDDDEGVRESIALFLREEGFAVEAFSSAADFLGTYSADREGCLVLDVTLPGMSGLALQETLAAKQLRVPIIFITGHGDVPMSVKAMKGGAFDLIEKPLDHARLSLRIREAIEWDLDRRQSEVLTDAQALETLHAIGDAVITTDASGVIKYLNPIAEQLTGWPVKEALGQPIEKVFNVVDEHSRKPAENLVSRCLLNGKTSRLAEHAVLIRHDGKEFPIEDSASPILGRKGETLGVVLVFKDATEQRRTARELAHRAMHDPLTGLVNRREFEKRLEHALASSKTRGAQHTLCYIDLDQFKNVNDTAGHAAGDELLRQVTALLMEKVRERDTLARLGGDEFGLLLNNCPTEKAVRIVEELIAEIQGFGFVVNDQLFKIGASVGLTPVAYDSTTVEELIRQADTACYSAKQLGRNRTFIWQKGDSYPPSPPIKMQRAGDLSKALSENHFLLYRQPIVSLLHDREETTGHELLIRLMGLDGEIVLPSAFIPTAERHGLMSAIDHWVIHSALHCYTEISGETANAEISINLSGSALNDESLLEYVHNQFGKSRTPPDRVCFEISETTAVHNLNQAQHFIKETRSLGCRFALDNFGSGLSSFSYLKKLEVDYVKIDGTYVRDMLTNPFYFSMVEAISNIGHSLGVRIIAEWVETQDVLTCLKDMGVDYAQGEALAPPEPLTEESLRSCSNVQ